MASPIAVNMILCDAAVADVGTGKVHMLGAGWSVSSSPTGPQAVALLIKIPWDRANERIPVRLSLVDSDGRGVALEGPEGFEPLLVTSAVEVGRPSGLAHGSPIDASLVVNFQPLPLAAGRYEWRLEIGDQTVGTAFQVR